MVIKVLNEMAYNRKSALNRCDDLGKPFIEHFDKIYHNPKDANVPHWIEEMSAWYNSVKDIKLKPSARHLRHGEIIDWFFIGTHDPEDLFEDEEEIDAYDSFIFELVVNNKSIENVLKEVLNIK